MEKNQKKSLTKLEQSVQDRKDFDKTSEEILAVGETSPSESRKNIETLEKEKSVKEKGKADELLTNASKARRFSDIDYLSSIRDAVVAYIGEIDFSDFKGWKVYVHKTDGGIKDIMGRKFVTDRGILVVIESPAGLFYHKGLRASFEPEMDVAGAWGLSVYVENTLDYYTQDSGIIKSPGRIKDAYGRLKRSTN